MIDGAGARLHYLDEGRGDPPVVLLHAFPLTARMWEPQLEAFAPSHRIVAPDLLGFGGSDVPAARSAYSVDVWADQVATLFTALGLERAVVVGLSMGGYVAFAFLRRRPEALAGLLLADTRAGADTDEIRSRREQQQKLLEAAGHPLDLADRLLDPLVGTTSSRREEVLAAAKELLAVNRAEGVIGGLEALKNRPDSTGDLARIGVPTTVVVGDQDQLSPPDVARAMAGAIANARLVVVPDAGHLTNLENPAAFNHALEDLLQRV